MAATQTYRAYYYLICILLVVSGNPAFYAQPWSPVGYIVIGVFLAIYLRKTITPDFLRQYAVVSSVFVILFFIQYINLDYLSIPFVLGFLVKIFIGSIIFRKIKSDFAIIFFDVMYAICLISLPFYALHYIGGDNTLKDIWLKSDPGTVGFYTFRPQHRIESFLRNSGMFWEPGAFQGYINLCIFMVFPIMSGLIKTQKFKLLVIIVAFLTTQSTTGYITFGVLIALYVLMYMRVSRLMVAFLFSIICVLGAYSFYNLDFLGDKIVSQYEEGVARTAEGEFDPRRFGALLFDLHYIQKNPLTGNGFNAQTRFADHGELRAMIERGENPGHGNGFSNFIASAGILGMFWYLYTIYRNQKKYGTRDALLLCLLIIILSQGEDFFRFPFFLGIAFFTPYMKSKHVIRNRSLTHLPQPTR